MWRWHIVDIISWAVICLFTNKLITLYEGADLQNVIFFQGQSNLTTLSAKIWAAKMMSENGLLDGTFFVIFDYIYDLAFVFTSQEQLF